MLRVSGLRASDARGRDLPARFTLERDSLVILVEDAQAAYPIEVHALFDDPAWFRDGDQSGDGFGSAVAAAGDVNADGYEDFLIGSPTWDGGQADEGRVLLFLGGPLGPGSAPSWTAEGEQPNARAGSAIAGAGDVNGDGFDDILVASPLFDSGETDEGSVRRFFGSAAGPAPAPGWTGEGNQPGAHFGASVAGVEDVNGDGFADFVIGGPGECPGDLGGTGVSLPGRGLGALC